ncbi:MAG: DNA-3-methyladenine glycosylase I [Nitrososphaeria archaeon]
MRGPTSADVQYAQIITLKNAPRPFRIDMNKEWTPPSWMYRGRKPPTDEAYFENLTRCIFQAGLSWRTITNKWPNFKKAFYGFDIETIASYGVKDIGRLMKDKGIIRNQKKILATIDNAREFKLIRSENGSFQRWLDSLDKTSNYANVVKRLANRFKHVGETTARIFLYTVGEEIRFPEVGHQRRTS